MCSANPCLMSPSPPHYSEGTGSSLLPSYFGSVGFYTFVTKPDSILAFIVGSMLCQARLSE